MHRVLYKAIGSPPARATLMVAELLQVPGLKMQNVDFFGGELEKENFLKLNPQHTIPTLVDGDFVIWDSHAINAYLVGTYGSDDSLYPKDLKKRALVDQRLHFDSGILFPALRYTIKDIRFAGAKTFNAEGLEKIEEGYDFMEAFLRDRKWLTGDQLTIGDISCVATASTLHELHAVNPNKYPRVLRWLQDFDQLDFYKKHNVAGAKWFGDYFRVITQKG